jgi:hypothetical protein
LGSRRRAGFALVTANRVIGYGAGPSRVKGKHARKYSARLKEIDREIYRVLLEARERAAEASAAGFSP